MHLLGRRIEESVITVSPKSTGGRQLKHRILKLLQLDDLQKGMAEMSRLPARQVINPLFLFLCSMDEKIKWNAVISMGVVVSALAEQDMESARVVMRRFMWNLNDESGGIGWGCPEAMGEIMARNKELAEEYGCILISYIRPDGNFLEHDVMQKGALWGVGRLAHARPKLLEGSALFLHPYLESDNATLRGLAAWAVGPLADESAVPMMERLADDHAKLQIFSDGQLIKCTISQLARKALKRVGLNEMDARR